jgi:hypothetical protein
MNNKRKRKKKKEENYRGREDVGVKRHPEGSDF